MYHVGGMLCGTFTDRPANAAAFKGWWYMTDLCGRLYYSNGVAWEQRSAGYFIRDTKAQLDAETGQDEGDLGYAKDTHRMYFWDGVEWRQIRY